MPLGRMQTFDVELLQELTRALLVRLESQRARRVAGRTCARLTTILLASHQPILVHVRECFVAVLVRVKLARDLVGQLALTIDTMKQQKRARA